MLLLILIVVILGCLYLYKGTKIEGLRGRRGGRLHRPIGRSGRRPFRRRTYYNWPLGYYNIPSYGYPYYYYPPNYNLCEDISYSKYRNCINEGKSKTLCADNLENSLRWC